MFVAEDPWKCSLTAVNYYNVADVNVHYKVTLTGIQQAQSDSLQEQHQYMNSHHSPNLDNSVKLGSANKIWFNIL